MLVSYILFKPDNNESVRYLRLNGKKKFLHSDHQTLYRVLETCKHSFNSGTATQTHARIIKFGYGAYPSLVAILISTYAHCHRLNLARRLIHQIFSWDFDLVSVNIVIESLMRIGECNFAKKVFDKMPTRDRVTWNSVIGG